jgi:Coenzyme PQQ synthesis protein D (PqqD)
MAEPRGSLPNVEPLLTSRVRRRADLAFRALEGQAWVLAPRESSLHRLNETASWLWARLDAQPTVTELGEALHAHFDVEASTAARDAESFVRMLMERGLVELVAPNEAEREATRG